MANILVAEDNAIMALEICDELVSTGHNVIGPFADALRVELAINFYKPDAAVLDLRLRDGTSIAAAKVLEKLNTPYVFLTVAQKTEIPDYLKPQRIFNKPCWMGSVSDVLSKSLGKLQSKNWLSENQHR